MKRLISLIVCAALTVCAIPGVFAEEPRFSDVAKDAWYYDDVMSAVELGIINGKTANTFAPDDNLTYAEAIKLATCMYQLYDEGTVYLVPVSDPWYMTYVDYADGHGVLQKNYDFEENATRAGYMEIFARALPADALNAINDVPYGSIPDVDMKKDYADEIYTLYRAGILTGVDECITATPAKP